MTIQRVNNVWIVVDKGVTYEYDTLDEVFDTMEETEDEDNEPDNVYQEAIADLSREFNRYNHER